MDDPVSHGLHGRFLKGEDHPSNFTEGTGALVTFNRERYTLQMLLAFSRLIKAMIDTFVHFLHVIRFFFVDV